MLHAAEASGAVPIPPHLPDLFPALFALFGCCSLLWHYVFFVHWLLTEEGEQGEGEREDKHGKRE